MHHTKYGTKTVEFVTIKETRFVRVHNDNQARSWIMKEEDVKDAQGNFLSATQIKDKYAIPDVPTQMSDVTVPAGTPIRAGIANPIPEYGAGEGLQYELLQTIPDDSFVLKFNF